MGAPVFGISILSVDEEGRPVMAADLSTIGIVGPSDDASATTFPLDTPVEFDSNELSKLANLGEDGYLSDAIRGINDQLDQLEYAARIIVVRTERGANENETIANIVGKSTDQTGLWALLRSGPELGFIPRLIVVPGYTGQMCNTIDTVVQESGLSGAGYVDGKRYELTFSGGGSSAFQATAHAYGQTDGSLGPAIMDTYGGYYESAPTVTVDDEPSPVDEPAVYTATITTGANPVCASLTPVLNQLMGHAIVESLGTSRQNDIDWRETIQSQRLIPTSGGCKILDTDSATTIVVPFAPRVAGIAVRRDHEKGGYPFHSWANQPIQGIIGPQRGIGFYLTDDASEGQELLRNNIGIIARGEAGVETAIASGGFVYVGTDTAAEDVLWQFYNVSRGRDFIHLTLIRALRWYLGRYNIVGHTIQAILNTMTYFLRDLKANDHILGYKVNFSQTGNSAEEIRLGHLTVGFQAEEPPVLTRLTIESARYRLAIDAMISELASQLNLAA